MQITYVTPLSRDTHTIRGWKRCSYLRVK